jgi:hypothetical protein
MRTKFESNSADALVAGPAGPMKWYMTYTG